MAPERRALEHRLDLGLGGGVSGAALGQGHGCRAQLGVGLAASDLLQVHGDEVVGVGLGLGARGQLLAGVLLQVGDHARGYLGARLGLGKRRGGREGDLLGRQLVLGRPFVGPKAPRKAGQKSGVWASGLAHAAAQGTHERLKDGGNAADKRFNVASVLELRPSAGRR
jgi:hypothetical protein